MCKKGEAEKSLPCPYQRYCAQKSIWEGTDGMKTCERRRKHDD